MQIKYEELENYSNQIYAVYDLNDGFSAYFTSKKEAIQYARKIKKVYLRRLCDAGKKKIRGIGANIIWVMRYNNYADYEYSAYNEVYSLEW